MSTKKARNIIEKYECEHNHSWYAELYQRNRNTLGDTALYYRDNHISYETMFEKMRILASAMQVAGVKKGTEIPVCLPNSPELVYVMGAASILGAVINVFSASFPLDYIEEILNSCDCCIGFFEDNYFSKIQSLVETIDLNRWVLCSLGDSLPSDTHAEGVEGHNYVDFMSSVKSLTAQSPRTVWFYDFMRLGENRELDLSESIVLDDVFTVTYTSGSTNALRPKAIVQRVRSFCVIGRFHDPDVTYGMKMKKFRWMAIIPPHSNTDLISCISDALMQGSILTVEPVYNESFFLDSLLINQPNIVIASRSFWLTAMKQLMEVGRQHIKMPFLLMALAVGEELSRNEERFLNRMLRKIAAGKEFHHLPVSPVCFCVGGGDCEHGSILHRLFRAISNFTLSSAPDKRYGMRPFDFVDVAVLDPMGNRLGPNQTGRLVADSPCTMKCYKNDPAATERFFIKDSEGKVWGDMSVYGYMDKKGKVYMRNRIMDDNQGAYPFQIADVILKSKAFLSCEVVKLVDGYVAHVEFLPGDKKNVERELMHAKQRCKKRFGKDISDNLFFRIHTGIASFKLTSSGKRDIQALIAEGMSKVETCNQLRL